MITERDIALIDELIQQGECSWLEFKHNKFDKNMIGKLCSALSNSARIEGHETAYIIWGIDDKTHEIIGTSFDPSSKLIGNQAFEIWLAQQLKPSIDFSFRSIAHPKGNVVLLEIPAPTAAPRFFTNMTPDERVRACYQHAVIKYIAGEKIKNASLRERFGIEEHNAAQVTAVIKATLKAKLIKIADKEYPKAGYIPIWV